MPNRKLLPLAAAACIGAASAASAGTIKYEAILTDLNNLGASGKVSLWLDNVANTLRVHVQAAGLTPDAPHVQHIHGVKNADGSNGDSKTPTSAQDTDGDGFIELLEGAATYGPIILSLTDEAPLLDNDPDNNLSGFPTAPNGIIDFTYTYDLLNTPAYDGNFDIADLLDLENREIVIHGALTPFELDNQIPGLGGGVADDGNGNPIVAQNGPLYNPALPVLAGEISAVPLPAAGWLLLAALGGVGAVRRSRKS